MDLRYTSEEDEFRAELRAWLDGVLPTVPAEPPTDEWAARRVWDTAWQRMLFEAGYAGINWPKEYGGRGATPTEHLIFLEETERARAPYVGMNFVGLLHAGPTLVVEASPEQKAAHLPPILRGEHVWCQGFSEPAAGSDLAALQCRAIRDGDDYVITGQKIWTSFAHVADYCELLVRTDAEAPKHRGITWLIMPMDRPGIDVRPLRTMDGGIEFSQVFLDEVRVPASNRVGEENDGWRVAMTTLSFERGTAFVSELLQTMELVRDLADLAKHITRRSDTVGKAVVSLLNYILVRLLFRLPLSDYQNVTFYPTTLIQSIQYEARSSFVSPEGLLKCHWRGASIAEVPISFIPRTGGCAKGTSARAIYASVTDIFHLWWRWMLLGRRGAVSKGAINRLRPEEWERLPDGRTPEADTLYAARADQ